LSKGSETSEGLGVYLKLTLQPCLLNKFCSYGWKDELTHKEFADRLARNQISLFPIDLFDLFSDCTSPTHPSVSC
jgi:hypothetical protein